ncbi:MAG: hypothetical protein RBS96_05450 [Dehalococcoidales bacterium]|jgi:hypothetical protein|nr:hypothetical protein [Dehalococcoidales bacterium]
MSAPKRGTDEFKEVWICDDLDITLDANSYMGPDTDPSSVLGQLKAERDAGRALLLDCDQGDTPLMAGAFFKVAGAGDPANNGQERKNVTFEAKIDGLQERADQAVIASVIALDGQRKDCYAVDRKLGIVEKALDQSLKIEQDGTNNQPHIKTVMGTQKGDLANVYDRKPIYLVSPTTATLVFVDPDGGESITAGTTTTIEWTGNFADPVKIELYKAGVLDSVINKGVVGTQNSYDWLVPVGQTPGTDYKVKVSRVDDLTLTDMSASDFTIAAP